MVQVVFIHNYFLNFGLWDTIRFLQKLEGGREGDPITPFLFVITMEALSCLVRKVVEGGCLPTCEVRSKGGKGIQVSYLLLLVIF